MDIGLQEIIIIGVIIVVLFVAVKLIGDKRYFKRSKDGAQNKNNQDQKQA